MAMSRLVSGFCLLQRALGQDLFLASTQSYLPVFMMHGVDDNAKSEFTSMTQWLQTEHPGTETYPIAMYEDMPGSWVDLNVQVTKISAYIRKTADEQQMSGYHLVCHSQGGILCRAIIEDMDDHRVHSFVSLAGPQMGVYGPAFFDFMKTIPIIKFLQNATYQDICAVVYNSAGQLISVANMWHDPVHEDLYLKGNSFLPKINGQTDDAEGNARRKANFLRLEKAVFLTGTVDGSDYEGGIEPDLSGVFSFFKPGSRTEMVSMKEQQVYVEDSFGLRSLDEAGKLVTKVVPGVSHHMWVDTEEVVKEHIFPHLV